MKLNHILSEQLPEIDRTIKECINYGQWLLFKADMPCDRKSDVVFYLKAGSTVFELNFRGQVLNTLEKDDVSSHINELFYFSDISQPCSLSNASYAFQ